MASKIIPLLPRHTVYVEPFCGGASIFFAKPWPPATNSGHYREVLNDVDGRVINMYQVVQDKDAFEEFRRLVSVPRSRAVHRQARDKLRAGKPIRPPDADAAAAYYTSICQSFSSELNAGWNTGVYGPNHAAAWMHRLEDLPRYLDRMLSVYLECDDALSVIERWDSPQTLFYCDPPYPGANQGHYAGYTQDDFAALCEALGAASGSVVLSCYDNAAVPDGWVKHEFAATCSASRKGKAGKGRDKSRTATASEIGDRKRTECVWVIDRSANARPEIQEIWAKWYGYKLP
jgi:DNA adenine methylase